MLELRDIKKSYGLLKVLDIPLWKVDTGETVVVFGPNGSGKTTLLEIIAGLIPRDSGNVIVDGANTPGKEKHIGIVLQNPVMFSSTVASNVAFGIRRDGFTRAQVVDKVNSALTMVGLEGYESRNAAKLSQGQMQRVALARTLVTSPKLLLLDEPSSNVDEESIDRIVQIIKRLHNEDGLTIVIATHNKDFANKVTTRIDYLREGRINTCADETRVDFE